MAYMSQEGYDKMVAELRHMETVDRPAASRRLQRHAIKAISRKTAKMMLQRKLKPCLR